MRFLYVTDLHGNMRLYEESLDTAVKESAALIVNGGDMLPKNGEGNLVDVQRSFLDDLRSLLKASSGKGISYFASFGNDDCRSLLPELDGLETDGLLKRMDKDWLEHRGMNFIAFPWVPDTPFLLKDWCLLDSRGWEPPIQFGPPLISTPTGFEELPIPGIRYLSHQESIMEKLSAPPYSQPPDPSNSVFIMHAPPAETELDVTWDGRRIGSRAGREYIQRWGFGLSLHGHVHESPQETGLWAVRLGSTLSINPGADSEPSWVLIDTESRSARHARFGTVTF